MKPRAWLLALLLAGCTTTAPPVTDWQPAEAPVANKVDFVRLSHVVRFAPGSATLVPAEADRLTNFIDVTAPGWADRVYLESPGSDPLSDQRRQILARFLHQHGVKLAAMRIAAGAGSAAAAGNQLAVDIERYVVTPPACPNWTKPAGGDYTNSLPSNFGCATTANLGLMVADPRDLVIGRKAGSGDIDRQVRMEEQFRTNTPQAIWCGKPGCPEPAELKFDSKEIGQNGGAAPPAAAMGEAK